MKEDEIKSGLTTEEAFQGRAMMCLCQLNPGTLLGNSLKPAVGGETPEPPT